MGRESILKLKDPNELKKIFDFVIAMVDVIDNKNEMFGIFSDKPESLRVLPGLQPNLDEFINSVDKLVSIKDGQLIYTGHSADDIETIEITSKENEHSHIVTISREDLVNYLKANI